MYIYISCEISIEHPSVGLASLAQLLYIRNSQLNRPESVSLASVVRQLEKCSHYGSSQLIAEIILCVR